MKTFMIFLLFLCFSHNAYAFHVRNFGLGYTMGYTSKHCSCQSEEYKIEELEQEIDRLKKQIEELDK